MREQRVCPPLTSKTPTKQGLPVILFLGAATEQQQQQKGGRNVASEDEKVSLGEKMKASPFFHKNSTNNRHMHKKKKKKNKSV